MGDVVTGKYHLSLSSWNWIVERNSFLDFVPVIKDREILAVVPSPPEVDAGLFTRPFRNDTWQGIGLMILFGIILLFGPFAFFKSYENSAAMKIVAFTGWTFFVLINAYYGGALTMFFVSEITLPFNTLRDALRVFPQWNLIYQSGNDAYFEIPASQVLLSNSSIWHKCGLQFAGLSC